MAITYTINGANSTVVFTYTGNKDKMLAILTGAAEFGWTTDAGKLFVDMTNQEKLNLIDARVKKFLVNSANRNKEKKAIEVTQASEQATEYQLTDATII